MSQKFLTIHGHFYQPPRENAWTEAIDRQHGASPYHDWNERIKEECYTPNAYARILDSNRRIDQISNNFELLSFNFGPTLLSWLQKFAARTYDRILEADRKSVERFGGHGSAIAQAYNHAIMPLCNEQDRITQIRWGLADFRYRFGREPESMWLPETAVNDEVLRALIDHDIKYVILSPYQAKRARPLSGGEWQWAEHGEIDSSQPYRWFDRRHDDSQPRRYIDLFFYHGELSRGVGFEKLASDAANFANRIAGSYASNGTQAAQLVSIATDGETYGHHERFGEMGLAYLLNVEAPAREIFVTNYGEYLAKHPPTWEVEIKEGPNGEGTAWSCAHGVGRWRRHCGCRGDGPADWNQEWRGPLREALDQLREELNQLLVAHGESVFRDPFEARNDYIHVILKRTPETVAAFLTRNQRRELPAEEKVTAIKLMEMQRNAQLMYTSCGWFFTELSGIETVQIIQYAARAIQLAEALTGRSYEDRFLQNLRLARSNMAQYGDGKGVYKKLVKPTVVSFVRVVNTYAIRSLFLGAPEFEKLYHYSIRKEDATRVNGEELTVLTGKVEAESGVTLEKLSYAYALVKGLNNEDLRCYVRKINPNWNYAEHRDHLIANLLDDEYDLIAYLDKNWGGRAFGLGNMFYEERQQVIQLMLQERLSTIGDSYVHLYKANRHLIHSLRELGATIPEELSVPTRYTLSKELRDEVRALGDTSDAMAYKHCLEISRIAAKLDIQLDTDWPSRQMQLLIEKRLTLLQHDFTLGTCHEIRNLKEIAQRLKFELRLDRLQDMVFDILQAQVTPLIEAVVAQPELAAQHISQITTFLQLAHGFGLNVKSHQQRIDTFVKQLADDPSLWP